MNIFKKTHMINWLKSRGGGQPNLQNKTVTPSTSQQIVSADNEYDGLDEVTINAVTSAIDNNIQASNIKNGVSILGVTGTYNPQPNLQSKDVTITTNGTTTIEPDSGYDGLSDVDITVNVSSGGTSEWEQIGYSGTPQSVLDDIAYSKTIMDNWDTSKTTMATALPEDRSYKLAYMPMVNSSNITNMSIAFKSCTKLSYIPLLNTTNVRTMDSTFYDCTALTTIPQLDTHSVTTMTNMFYNCRSLTTIPLLNTSNVTNMYAMFSGCIHLTSIPLLNTSNVDSMYQMFNGCSTLVTIPLLDTSNLTSMYSMFFNCTHLTSIPLLNTSRVYEMGYVFSNCGALVTVPQLDTSSVTNMTNMFNRCNNLSNDSLNNILAMCANAAVYSRAKTLKIIGISQAQATTCQSLSNYQDFLDAGWTTGY